MSVDLGDRAEDSTINFLWSTNDGDGASITRATDGTVSVYKDNGDAQSTAGIADTEDFDSLTGIHACTIDLSADAFYATGADYAVVLSAATIDGQTVNAVLAHFSIENRGVAVAKAVWDRVLTGATHNVPTSAGRRLRTLQDFGVYDGGHIYIDTVDGVAGTTDYENGTVNNPVDSLADALTIAASVNLHKLYVRPGSSITFAASMDDFHVTGDSYTVALGGESCDNAHIEGANVSGTFLGDPLFSDCVLGNITGPNARIRACGIGGTVTIDAVGDWFVDSCWSEVAGTGTPGLDFGSGVGSSNVSWRHYSGGLEIENIGDTGTDVMSFEGMGRLILNANCDGGTIAVRGLITVTDNASEAVTLSDDARIDLDNLADAVWDETSSGHTDAGKAGEQLWTDLDAVLADTNELQVDHANGGRLDLIWDAIKAVTDALPDAGALDDLALILADTDELQTDWTNGGRLDNIQDAVLLDTDELQTDWTNGGRLDVLLDTVLADTAELQTDHADGGRLDLIWDAIKVKTDGILSAAEVESEVNDALVAMNLDHWMLTPVANNADMTVEVADGTALSNLLSKTSDTSSYTVADDSQEGIADGSTTAPHRILNTTVSSVTSQLIFVLTDGATIDNAYNAQSIVFIDSNGDKSVRQVTDYDGGTTTVTIDSEPDFTVVGTDGVEIYVTGAGTSAPTVSQIADGVMDELVAGHTVSGSFAESQALVRVKSDQLAFSQANAVDAVITYAGTDPVTSADDLKADVSIAAEDLWDALLASHIVSGSFGEAIGLISNAVGVTGSLYTYTVTEAGSGAVVSGATVYVSADSTGTNKIAVAVSDNDGEVTFFLEPATTYYFFRQHPVFAFSNPDTETTP